MRRSNKDKLEFRFYDLPPGESVLALLGEDWVGRYGENDTCLHFHNLFEIGYCHYGHGLLILGEDERVYEDGMFSAIPANVPHITVSEDEDAWEFLFLDPGELLREMYPNQPEKQEQKLSALMRSAALFHAEEQPELAATVRKILREMHAKRPYYRETVRHLARIYLLELLRVQEDLSDRVEGHSLIGVPALSQVLPALTFIEEHYTEEIRAAQLAACCGLSEPHFRRVFEERVHMSPMDYLNRVRVHKACRLLNRRSCSMDVAAEECGFASTSAFTRNFKKYMDMTPYQWKRNKGNYPGQLQQFEITAQKGWGTL